METARLSLGMLLPKLNPYGSAQKVDRSEKSQVGSTKKEGSFAALLQETSSKPKTGISEQKSFRPLSAKEEEQEEINLAVQEASSKYNLPPELINAVIKQESHFNSRAVSPVGAQGLMQLMPSTAREMGVKNSFDIRQNVDGGSKYLRQMIDRFDGDLPKAIAAYNAGPGAVEKAGGIPPYAETQNYVPSVLKNFFAELGTQSGYWDKGFSGLKESGLALLGESPLTGLMPQPSSNDTPQNNGQDRLPPQQKVFRRV
ncbi:MAG: lytic transglycosylase domain-containing protein [Deltaproteobacteria bacterium]|nr:lytic transglycosylase domain-containing protein [Deltaproteobacteria bacterium]